MSIILLRGFSNSGKDFIGNILCEKYGYQRFAFADSLKKIIADSFGCQVEQLHSQEGKLQICESDERKRTFRQILIDEALRLRNIDAGVFAKHCCQAIASLNPDKIVITDWRYTNELEIISSLFPNYRITTVHIQRVHQENSPINDISEYQLVDRREDFVVINHLNETIYDEVKKLYDFIYSTLH
jgi:hypothetical protein